ncbi:uncharacterized protein FFB14_10247 [Fusarium fujikuroi]|nr:uncharacterized protein FFB14_10247 [Fusarium fujikuroi]
MPPKMPRLDDLLALLEVYFAPEMGVLPGGTATKAELEAQLRPPPVFILLPNPRLPPPAAALGGSAVVSRHRRLERLFWASQTSTRHDLPEKREVTLLLCTPFDCKLPALLVPNLPTDVDFDFPSAPPCYNSKLVSLQQASLLCWRFHWLRLTFEISASPASPLPCRLCHPFEGAVSATFPFPPLEPTSFIECRHFRLSFEDTLLPC